jgi:hypothetical protein
LLPPPNGADELGRLLHGARRTLGRQRSALKETPKDDGFVGQVRVGDRGSDCRRRGMSRVE